MIFTADKLKEARDAGYSDDEIWSHVSSTDNRFNAAKSEGYSLDEVATFLSSQKPADTSIGDTLQTAAEELEAGVGRAGSAFAKSAVGSVRMFTDLFGANNKVSKEIAGVEDYIDQFTTAQAKQDKEEISRLFQEAEGKGLGNKVMAGLKAVAVSPETLGPEMAGYMLPSLAAGVLTGGASLPIQIGAQATIGAAQAAGSIKGDIYQSVRDYSREQGLDEVEADRAATEAQSYGGKNLDLILTNAGIGALAASTGAERIATRILTGRGKDVTKKTLGEFLKQGAAAGGVEALTEGTQEAAEQISQNIALQREGKDVPTFQNVPQVATMGAVAGGVIGGGLKGVEFLSAEERAEQDINRSADREARSLSATDSTTKKVINNLNQSENAIDSLRQELDTLEPADPKAQQLRMRISEEQKKATGLKQSLGEEFLSEPITEAEKQQIELAKAITAPEVVAPVSEVAPEVALPVTEPITPAAEVAPPVPAVPVAEAVPAPTEPTIKESLPVAKVPAEVRKMAVERQKITPRTPQETDAFNKASSNKVMARNPELAIAAVRLNNSEITAGEYADLIDTLDPFTSKGAESIPEKSKIDQYIDESKKDKVNAPIESGKEVEFRIDIPTYNRSTAAGDTVYAVTAHEPVPETSKRVGTPISYVGVAKVINPKMMTRSISGKGEAIDIATGSGKFPLATVKGNYEAITELPADINDPNVWTEVSYNPIRSSYFVDVRSKNAVVSGDEAIMVGSRVFVKNPKMEARPKGLLASDKRYMAFKPTPLAENERYGEVKLNRRIQKYFGGKIPDRVYVVDDAVDEEYEYKAAYYPSEGILILNNAFIKKNENIGDIIAHELGHYAFGDKKFKEAFDKFYNSLSPEEKAEINKIVDEGYSEETEESQIEERKVIAFTSYTIVNPQRRSLWNAVLDALKVFANKIFGKNFQMSDPNRTALAILSTAKKQFAAGNEIVREEDMPRKMVARPEKIMGEEVGPLKTTPEGIIAKTQELLRKKFDPTKVSESNTTEAFRALGRLTGRGGTDFAKELNDVGRVVDKSGAASEISMGAALFINDLFEYSIRLAAEGNKKLLGMMLTNINKLPTAAIGVSDAARDLRARLELAQRFLTMAEAEQDAYTNYVAEFIYGPNPTKDQIQSIKDAYAAVEKTPEITEQELTDEIAAVGGRTGTDLVGKINEEFTKATEKKTQQRKTEEAELDEEYKKVQKQADAEIEKLAKIQSDTPSFDPAAARQITNDVRAIVSTDLKQRPDMGRKAPWKSLLVAKLQEAGVELAAAETLADIVWRQHEINSLSRELSSINKAIENGPISEIVKAIKDTPLEDQQNPNWRYEVMRDYLRKAGLNVAQAERIAKLMDISLQKRFTMAQEQAFTDAISKTAPWKSGDTRSRRAFQKVLQALRAGALDPARNVLSDMAALNGWTGFSPDQYKTLLKNDAILSDPKSADATKAEAHKVIQDIISKAKLPIRARDVIGQYYDAQALSGIQTATVNIFSPAGMAAKNVLTQALNGVLTARPEQITASLTTFIDSIKSWANTVAYSFKNNVTVYSNVEYLVNDEGLLKLYKKGVDQFNNGKTPRERADGVKNMMIGMMDYVRRVLNALDYGAIASLQNQAVSKYALAVMQAKGMSSKDGAKMLNAMMEQKRNFYNDQIAIGTDKNKAAVLADEFFISSWRQALTDAKLPAQEVMDAALNDAMSAVGRNRQSLDAFREEDTNTRDEGVFSFPALWLLETMANAANQKNNQFIKIFSRIIYGFAVVPARVLRETAWFSPYGAVRFAYDYIAKKMGKASPYAQSLGNDLQYRQRLTETAAGTLVMLAFAAAMSPSTEDEEDKKPFKIVVTGNGPLRSEDPQYYDSWMKKNKPNTVSVYFGKTKFTINTMRGFEAFAWPAMMLGAVDDWHIRRKQKRETNTPMQMQDAAIVGGFVLSASLRRGPYAFAAKPLFESYGDRGVESLTKSLAFPAKTLIPGLGSSLAKNFSDLLNEPVDRKTLEGALWANIPFIGPAVAPKSLNAFGEPALANEAADKIFKLGIPITFEIPNDRQSVMLHELVLKQGGGPSIPNRSQLAKRLDREPTNKEFEMFVKEYGLLISEDMKANYTDLFQASAEGYSKYVEKIGNVARDIAETRVREKFEKP